MIEFVAGNLLDADAEALVNTVNSVGVMGKGIALQFKRAFPTNFQFYEKACRRGEVAPGKMLVFATKDLVGPRFIINFPTKRHWRSPSRMEYIEAGLDDLRHVIENLEIASIAVPPLGAGSGGPDWLNVKPRIERALSDLCDIRVLVFEPSNSPESTVLSPVPQGARLTRPRAMLVLLLGSYAVPGYRSGLLEVQKLAYFLQRAGEDLRLSFVKQRYGPYSENLNHVLQVMEGHLTSGYGDRTGRASIAPNPGAIETSEDMVRCDQSAEARLSRVKGLIEGFESPYGLELLASVDWVATHDPAAVQSPELAIAGVQSWSLRKKTRFRPEHIRLAWQRLHDQGWWAATP